MEKPLVSVLMTAYNREKYIGEAIESVLNSTYQNWELIITDDQSKDNTYQIAKSYADKDERIKIYLNEVNLKDYPNRNRAASYAKGKYLKYLDADDMFYPHSLDVMIRCMEENPTCAIGLTINKIHSQKRPFPIVFTPEQSYQRQFLDTGMFLTGPTGMIVKRDVFEILNGFQVDQFAGDTEFLLRIACKYNSLVLPKDLFWWREHDEQQIKISHTKGKADVLYYKIYLKYLESSDCPITGTELFYAKKKLKRRFCINLLRMTFKHHLPLKAFQMYREADLTVKDFFISATRDKKLTLKLPM